MMWVFVSPSLHATSSQYCCCIYFTIRCYMCRRHRFPPLKICLQSNFAIVFRGNEGDHSVWLRFVITFLWPFSAIFSFLHAPIMSHALSQTVHVQKLIFFRFPIVQLFVTKISSVEHVQVVIQSPTVFRVNQVHLLLISIKSTNFQLDSRLKLINFNFYVRHPSIRCV